MAQWALILYDAVLLYLLSLVYRSDSAQRLSEWTSNGAGPYVRGAWTLACVALVVLAFVKLGKSSEKLVPALWIISILVVVAVIVFPLAWYIIGYVVVYHIIWGLKHDDAPFGFVVILLFTWWTLVLEMPDLLIRKERAH